MIPFVPAPVIDSDLFDCLNARWQAELAALVLDVTGVDFLTSCDRKALYVAYNVVDMPILRVAWVRFDDDGKPLVTGGLSPQLVTEEQDYPLTGPLPDWWRP